jgi:hypothetical protein
MFQSIGKFFTTLPDVVSRALDQFLFGGVFHITWGMEFITFLVIIIILILMRFITNKNNPINKGLSWVVTILVMIEMLMIAF